MCSRSMHCEDTTGGGSRHGATSRSRRARIALFSLASFTTILLIIALSSAAVAVPHQVTPLGAMPARPVPFDETGQPVAAGEGVPDHFFDQVATQMGQQYPGIRPPTQGTANIPVLLVQYSGQQGQITAQQFDNALFQINGIPTGSMNDYIREVSYNKLSVTGTVFGWFTLSRPEGSYVNGMGGMGPWPRNSQELVREAVLAADPNVNFAQFDNDGPDGLPNSGDDDGFVDCVMVVVNGYAAESYWPPTMNEMWSHFFWETAWGGPGAISVDGVQVDLYTVQSELRGTGGNVIRDIGVFAHEFIHALGVPDLRSTAGAAWQQQLGQWNGLGLYDVMGFGSWGAGGAAPDTPHHPSGFVKAFLGWADVVFVDVNLTNLSIPAVETADTLYANFRFWNVPGVDLPGPPPTPWQVLPPPFEGFLVENRQSNSPGTWFDQGLPGSGLLVYHYDGTVAQGDYNGDGLSNWQGNDVLWSENRPLVDLECADQTGPDHTFNADDLDAQNNFGDATDFFNQANAPNFDWTTNPTSVYYSGFQSSFGVQNIGPSGARMTADIVVGAPPGPNHDVWVKDCDEDDGSTPSWPNCDYPMHRCMYTCPDIWIDNDRDGYRDNPVAGSPNWLHAKVRNQGPNAVDYVKVWLYDLSQFLSSPPQPAWPQNPFFANALICSTTVQSLASGDSTILQVPWTVPPHVPWLNSSSLGICIQTSNDVIGMSGYVGSENNLAQNTWRDMYLRSGSPGFAPPGGGASPVDAPASATTIPTSRKGRLLAGLTDAGPEADAGLLDPPPEPGLTVVPLNNPYDYERDFVIDVDMELPPGWFVELFSPEFGPLPIPALVVLPALHVTELEVHVIPDPGALHGDEAHIVVMQYLTEFYPDPVGQIGAVDLPIRVDVYEPLPVEGLVAEIWDHQPDVPPICRVQLEWDPVIYDISGLEEEIAYYSVFRDTIPGFPVTPDNWLGNVAVNGLADPTRWGWSDTDTPLEPTGPEYYYRVVAVDKAGNESEPCEAVHPDMPADYLDHDIGTVRATVTDQGSFGFMEPDGRGNGFIYPEGGDNLTYTASLWVASEPTEVANRDYNAEPVKEWARSDVPDGHLGVTEPGDSDQDIDGWFRDSYCTLPKWLVQQTSYAWADPMGDFVIMEYRLRNESGLHQPEVFAGFFIDWDVGDFTLNNGDTDLAQQLCYMWPDAPGGPYCGVRLIPPFWNANISLIQNDLYVYGNGYIEDPEKYDFMVGIDPAHQILTSDQPRDWSMVVSSGPYDLDPDEVMLVAFAIVAGDDLGDLQLNADQAVQLYYTVTGVESEAAPTPARLVLHPVSPNPFNPRTEIRYLLPRAGRVDVGVFNVMGRRVATLVDGLQTAGEQRMTWDAHGLPSGPYFLRIDAAGETRNVKMMLVK